MPTYSGSIGTSKPALAYWKMDEGTGTTISDSSGNSHTATLPTGATWTTGKVGSFAISNTNSNYISFSPSVIVTRPFSIALWFNAQAALNGGCVLISDATSSRTLELTTSGNLVWFDTTSWSAITLPVSQGAWYHLAMSLDSAGLLTLYVNGAVARTFTGSNVNPGTVTFTKFGLVYGFIDDLRVYNSTLSSAEIAGLAAAGDAITPLSVSHPTVSSSGTRIIFQGTGNLTKSTTHPTISSAGAWSIPARHGTASLSRHPTFTATGGEITPNYSGTTPLGVAVRHPTISSTTSYAGPATGSLPLFMWGTQYPSWIGQLGLNIGGVIQVQGSVPMATAGRSTITGSMPLYMFVKTPLSKSLGLFLKADPVPSINSSIQLSVRGSPVGYGGVIRSMPMAVSGWDNPPYHSLNLYVKGMDRGALSAVLNLNVRGANPTVSRYMPLSIQNNNILIGSDLLLYIAGAGVMPGAIPIGGRLNLHVERGSSGGITLYLENKWGVATLPLHIEGHPSFNGQMPLFITGLGGSVNKSMNLVIPSVIAPVSINSSVPLSIPKVVDRPVGSIPISIVGWKI